MRGLLPGKAASRHRRTVIAVPHGSTSAVALTSCSRTGIALRCGRRAGIALVCLSRAAGSALARGDAAALAFPSIGGRAGLAMLPRRTTGLALLDSGGCPLHTLPGSGKCLAAVQINDDGRFIRQFYSCHWCPPQAPPCRRGLKGQRKRFSYRERSS